ncbi:MAG: biotin/lipoyl-containing protein, partial [Deltaproteobacteria bacterium]|nr:biotin/lipoyl-containing protein [Deltaproteobacteria bacterium]
QMHEQKLIEVSVTQEGLRAAGDAAKAAGAATKAKALATDLATLQRMEAEAERFGRAVKLDSASTFECIVEGDRHYFMEVNTRIQVEHRVSELCYALRFTNPADANDHFDVHSLIEAMAIVARHKTAVPRPTRVQREGAALEVRLNATDGALQPAAGGVLVSWSDPIDAEIRDDQGISIKNPDTGLFMRYRLAGAYDSNVALLLATGADRGESWARLTEALRCTKIRGIDLATNREFHFGLMKWFLHRDVWAKPTTAFVVPYLTAVGLLAREAHAIDLEYAFHEIERRRLAALGAEARPAFDLKETLLERPLRVLVNEPHFLSAWLSQHRADYAIADGRVEWKRNPLEVLSDTYRLLDMVGDDGAAAECIWGHDRDLLDTGLAFYAALAERVPAGTPWRELDARLRGPAPSFGIEAGLWARVQAAHAGHQLGMEILGLIPLIGERAGFFALTLADDLTPVIPAALQDKAQQEASKKLLAPPPVSRSDEIAAAMGGVYWDREAPTLPPFVEVGMHFEKGQPLYIIEVMKMFNKVYAPFAGRIVEVFMHDNGATVRKGQPLFRVDPDEKVVDEDPAARTKRLRANTDAFLASLL